MNGNWNMTFPKKISLRKPKVLFLACYFPPLRSTASVRTWNIAKYLARTGWDVTVVTPHPSLWRSVEDPHATSASLQAEGISRILTGQRWRCLSPDFLQCSNTGIGWVLGGMCRRIARYWGLESEIGWIKPAEHACASLTPSQVDVIFASGPPFGSFALARHLSKQLRRPYVLDYRDPWVMTPQRWPSNLETKRRLERDLVEGSSAVTVVSKSLLNGKLDAPSKIHVITNGFDPEELNDIEPHQFDHFAIVYAGVFYPPKRVITPLMRALSRIKEAEQGTRIDWKFHYYGKHEDHVSTEARKFGVAEKVVTHGKVSRSEALSAVRGSNVTVVITSVLEEKANEDRGIVTGKIFEPLGMRVPVLLIGPSEADVDDIIEVTGLTRKVTAKNIDGMVSFLQEVMAGKSPEAKNPDVYAWPMIVKHLDAMLRRTVDNAYANGPASIPSDGGTRPSELTSPIC
jgi:hypothetical protein